MGLILPVIGIVVIIRKTSNEKSAIIIDEQGVTDNTKKQSIGPIEWQDISHISIIRDGVLKILLIDVYAPEKYLERLGKFTHKAQDPREDYKTYGTPFTFHHLL